MKRRCWFECGKDMDERQQLLRGKVFQHTVALLFVLLMANGLAKSAGVTWAEGMWENLLIMWAGMALAMYEFILRGIMSVGSRLSRILFPFEGIVGLILTVGCSYHIFSGGEAMIANGMLTSAGGELIEGCVMLSIGLVFLGRLLYDKGRENVEE